MGQWELEFTHEGRPMYLQLTRMGKDCSLSLQSPCCQEAASMMEGRVYCNQCLQPWLWRVPRDFYCYSRGSLEDPSEIVKSLASWYGAIYSLDRLAAQLQAHHIWLQLEQKLQSSSKDA